MNRQLRERAEAVRNARDKSKAALWLTPAWREADTELCQAKAKLFAEQQPEEIILALLDQLDRQGD